MVLSVARRLLMVINLILLFLLLYSRAQVLMMESVMDPRAW